MSTTTETAALEDEHAAEREVLALANDRGKFAVPLFMSMGSERLQFALERLQERDWVRLIDLTPLAVDPNRVFRIFLMTKPARVFMGLEQ